MAVVDYAVNMDEIFNEQAEREGILIYNNFKEKMEKAEAQARDGVKCLSLDEVLANFDTIVKTHERV